jgi:hypothetical protein
MMNVFSELARPTKLFAMPGCSNMQRRRRLGVALMMPGIESSLCHRIGHTV